MTIFLFKVLELEYFFHSDKFGNIIFDTVETLLRTPDLFLLRQLCIMV